MEVSVFSECFFSFVIYSTSIPPEARGTVIEGVDDDETFVRAADGNDDDDDEDDNGDDELNHRSVKVLENLSCFFPQN